MLVMPAIAEVSQVVVNKSKRPGPAPRKIVDGPVSDRKIQHTHTHTNTHTNTHTQTHTNTHTNTQYSKRYRHERKRESLNYYFTSTNLSYLLSI